MSSVVSSLLQLFPECPGYGFSVQPQYLVKIVAREGGRERIDRRWSRPLIKLTATPIGNRDEDAIQSVLYFWHAMGGRATTFLFKDWTDWKSCQTQEGITELDQPLRAVTLLDDSVAYQLVKAYTVGSFTQLREITQPVGDTVVVANESGDAQTDFIIDEDGGLLRPGAGFTGTPTTWGGEFNLPVRFDSELDVAIADRAIQAVNFTLAEKRVAPSLVFVGGEAPWDSTSFDDLGFSFRQVVYGEGKLVAVDFASNVCVSDDDGASWTIALAQADSNLGFSNFPCVSYGHGKFMAGGADATSGASAIFQSADGTTWLPVSSVDDISAINGIGYAGGSNWVATSVNAETDNYVRSTDDGATWSAVTTTPIGLFYGNPIYHDATNGRVVTIGGIETLHAPAIFISTDSGTTWTQHFASNGFQFGTAATSALSYDGNTFVLGGVAGDDSDEPSIISATTAEGLATADFVSLADVVTNGGFSIGATLKVADKVFAFDDVGAVYNSADDGATFVLGNLGTPTEPLASQPYLAFDSDNDVLVAMLNSRMARFTL